MGWLRSEITGLMSCMTGRAAMRVLGESSTEPWHGLTEAVVEHVHHA